MTKKGSTAGAAHQRCGRRPEARCRTADRIGGAAVRGGALGRRYLHGTAAAHGTAPVGASRRPDAPLRLRQGTVLLVVACCRRNLRVRAASSVYEGLRTIIAGGESSRMLWINYPVLAISRSCSRRSRCAG